MPQTSAVARPNASGVVHSARNQPPAVKRRMPRGFAGGAGVLVLDVLRLEDVDGHYEPCPALEVT